MFFPARDHQKLMEGSPPYEPTAGETDYLYTIYRDGVLNEKIKIHERNIDSNTYNYLKDKSGFEGQKVVFFLHSLRAYADKWKNELFVNPILSESKAEGLKDFIQGLVSTPVDVVTKAVGTGTENISKPLTKPLIAVSVIAASAAFIYFGISSGIFKKVAKSFRK